MAGSQRRNLVTEFGDARGGLCDSRLACPKIKAVSNFEEQQEVMMMIIQSSRFVYDMRILIIVGPFKRNKNCS